MGKQQYEYFDTPDGQDVDKKLLYVLKPASLVAMGIATCDVLANSQPKGYINILGRYAFIALPIVGIAGAFVTTTNVAATIRGKDDEWNWVAGGLVVGALAGAWTKSSPFGWVSAFGFAGVAAGKKHCVLNGYVIHPTGKINPAHGGVRAVRHDFSLLKDNPGAWRRA